MLLYVYIEIEVSELVWRKVCCGPCRGRVGAFRPRTSPRVGGLGCTQGETDTLVARRPAIDVYTKFEAIYQVRIPQVVHLQNRHYPQDTAPHVRTLNTCLLFLFQHQRENKPKNNGTQPIAAHPRESRLTTTIICGCGLGEQ